MKFEMLLLAGAGAEGGEGGGGMQTLLMFGLIFLVFYFFMIRPQQKRAKEQKKFRESLEKGTKVVTIGGIHGKVLEVNDDTVLIQVDGAKLRVEKGSISVDSSGRMTEDSKKTAT